MGATLYHIAGYLDAKKEDPNIKYTYNYLLNTAIAVLGTGYLYVTSDIVIGIDTLLMAFIGGMGGNVAVTKILKLVKK